jgi:hypothetical protein
MPKLELSPDEVGKDFQELGDGRSNVKFGLISASMLSKTKTLP